MVRRLIVHLALAAATLPCALSSCSSSSFSFSKRSDNGLTNVDELLTRIEKVQVESLVAKERARAAYDTLAATVAPDFDGEALKQFEQLEKSIEDSEKQAQALGETVPALKSAANSVFERWTKDLESFGNTRMRQRSQERMEATREHYEMILRQTVSSQLAMEALNADISDHALFLGHDFNSESAEMIRDDVAALESRIAELDGRLDATIQSAKQYIASRALRGEVEGASDEQAPGPKGAAKGQRRRARQQTETSGAEGEGAAAAANPGAPGGTH